MIDLAEGLMNQFESKQKKKIIFACLYALIVGGLVIACAVFISNINKAEVTRNFEVNVGFEEPIQVATSVFVVPMKNATISKDYSAKELQYNDTLKQWEIHKAIDFTAGEDLSVYAISDGVVSNVYSNYLEGTVVEITHSNGLVSVYKSLSNEVVKTGDKVSAGQKIADAGETMAQELNSGKHLHLELLKNGTKVNPNDYLDLGAK